ncbi:MAG: hypothetical protein JXA13_05920 [Anaerolineales bacterium]|nr:hypothetical protein [Anaerolineales bacterium]
MRKLSLSLLVLFAFVTASCAQMPAAPPPVVETVVVTVVATQPAPPTPIPTLPPPPTAIPTLPPPDTATPEPTAEPAEAPAEPAANNASPADPPAAEIPVLSSSDGVFTSITWKTDHFSLRCVPKSNTFTVVIDNGYVERVYLYYRIRDKKNPDYLVSEWKNGGEMEYIGKDTYEMVFSGELVHPDLRAKEAFFDFQFIATNKVDDVVSRTEKLEDYITYSIDCIE